MMVFSRFNCLDLELLQMCDTKMWQNEVSGTFSVSEILTEEERQSVLLTFNIYIKTIAAQFSAQQLSSFWLSNHFL